LFVEQPADIAEPDADAPEDAEARQERHRRILQELAEIGMQIARAVRDEALARAEVAAEGSDADASAPPARGLAADPGLTYSRIAKAVRLTLALETRLADGLEKARVERARSHLAAIRQAADEHQQDVRDYVAEAIEADGVEHRMPRPEVERLLDELDERLEAGEYDDMLDNAPTGELVARICQDLGVEIDWDLWNGQDWADDFKDSPAFTSGYRPFTIIGLPPAPPTAPPTAQGPPPDPG
jgi:hypothetical protein